MRSGASTLPLLIRRTLVLLIGIVLLGLVMQLPILPDRGDGAGHTLAGAAARFAGFAPERIGVSATNPVSLRKMATATVLSLVIAAVYGLWRGDSSTRLLAGIPRLSARDAGVVRMALALGLAWAFVATGAVEAVPVESQRRSGLVADWPLLHTLAADTDATRSIHSAVLVAVTLVGLGLWTRMSTLALAALTTLHVALLLQRQSAHDWGLPTVALWLLVLVPWGDALSIDAWWRRTHGQATRQRADAEYGLAVWIPGLGLGVALLAAAFAKLDTSGVAWITSGAVRYHFVTDAVQAPVDWGLRIATDLRVSQLMSLGAVLAEAVFILHLLTSRARWRVAAGAVALALLAGFRVFQGVFWPMWWVLLLAFVPWPRRPPTAGTATSGLPPLRRWQVAVLGLFVIQQVIASGIRIEIEPFVSDYPMYASTYRSIDEFDRYLADKRGVRFNWTTGRLVPIQPQTAAP
jgi:hypothetical protein